MAEPLIMRDHQQKAYDKAMIQNILVFYEQGLGKTLVGVELTRSRIELGKTLIVTKKSLIGSEWLPALERQQAGLSAHANLIVTSYSQLHNLSSKTYTTLILDESHLVKNKRTKRFKAVKSLKAKRKLFLTGTPLDHRLIEIFWQLHLLEPTVFKMSLSKYLLNAENKALTKEIAQALNERWTRKFAPYIIKAQMQDHNPIPIRSRIIPIEMTPTQKSLYTTFEQANDITVVWNDTLWVVQSDFVKTLRLRQISTFPMELNKSAVMPLRQPVSELNSPKVVWLENYLECEERRRKAVVFSTMRGVVDYIANKYNVKPNTKNPNDLCVGTYAGMATGIDLPHHTTTIIIDGDYSRILHSQASTRFIRLNSTGERLIIYLIASKIDHDLHMKVQAKQKNLVA